MAAQNAGDFGRFPKVITAYLTNFVYFFAPFMLAHGLALCFRPWLILDPRDDRGPWEFLWHSLLDRTTSDPYNLVVYGTFLAVLSTYWTGSILYFCLDYAQWPEFIRKYKIQPGTNTPLKLAKVAKLLLLVHLNLLMNLPACHFMYRHFEKHSNLDVYAVPSFPAFLLHMVAAMVGNDTVFYHVHRLLHHKRVYKYIHKVHHEWTAPIAASCIYAHPVEHIFVGIVAPTAGMMVTLPPLCVAWTWLMWELFQTLNDHSGYHLPLVYSPEFHDFHHSKFHTCYGWLGFWDWYYGTDSDFEKSPVNKERHIRLHTLMSARQIVPDEKEE